MSAPWSKLKARVEALWDPALPRAIHCTAYANNRSRKGESRLSRHWLVLSKEIIWNFPGDFMGEASRGRPVPHCDPHFANGGGYISDLLREYLDRPVADLFKPFEADGWELTDVLRAADRRLGRAALRDWAKALDAAHPANRVLLARFDPA